MFFLLGFFICAMVMLWETPKHPTAGQAYLRGYFDCMNDHKRNDPAEKDDITPPQELNIKLGGNPDVF